MNYIKKKYLIDLAEALNSRGVIKFLPKISTTDKNIDIDRQEEADAFSKNLYTLNSIIKNAYSTLNFTDSNQANNIPLSQILETLRSNQIINTTWHKSPDIKRIIDQVSNLKIGSDLENRNFTIDSFRTNKIHLNSEIASFLSSYTKALISNHVKTSESLNQKNEFTAQHPLIAVNKILFFVKYLSNRPYKAERDYIIEISQLLKEYDKEHPNHKAEFVIVVFSKTEATDYISTIFKFDNLKKELLENNDIANRITLILANTNELSQLDNDIRNYLLKLTNVTFSHSLKSTTEDENNIKYIGYGLNSNHKHIKVTITPINSPFWRFGFLVNDMENIQEDDPINPTKTNIHLCIGDRDTEKKWKNKNRIYLTEYNVSPKSNYEDPKIKYTENTPIILEILRNNDNLMIRAFYNSQTIIEKSYSINNEKIMHFMGWSNGQKFQLNLSFTVNEAV